ncbi:MAG: hypothetical protein K8L99_20430 [Anaerolineae bacterium]|nr:hypothetical protein [Anaerolineae bacterium]MCZ2113578.1 hypothetical protein [Anaerolineae bacterium]GIK44864.1 MAG: hypothetical protein BroJett012_07670 [Betaproteobacteria bacterium]
MVDDCDLRKTVNWLERSKIVEILESYGFQCYDSESTDELCQALVSNIEDGTIDPSVLN